jgi:cob(I)alamin adenosyltransferase
LLDIQRKLLSIGSIIATPNPKPNQKLPEISNDDVESIEHTIDIMDENMEPLTTFIVQSGTSLLEAQAHICRTITRRAEREILKYGNVDENICKFMNRLSDYFFTLARFLQA